jgi:hypothetical protein
LILDTRFSMHDGNDPLSFSGVGGRIEHLASSIWRMGGRITPCLLFTSLCHSHCYWRYYF